MKWIKEKKMKDLRKFDSIFFFFSFSFPILRSDGIDIFYRSSLEASEICTITISTSMSGHTHNSAKVFEIFYAEISF